MGTNILVGQDAQKLRSELANILDGNAKKGTVPPLWEGLAGERIANILTGEHVSQTVSPTDRMDNKRKSTSTSTN